MATFKIDFMLEFAKLFLFQGEKLFISRTRINAWIKCIKSFVVYSTGLVRMVIYIFF